MPPNSIILQPRPGGLRTGPASNQESLAQTGKPAAAYVYAEIAVDENHEENYWVLKHHLA